MNIRRRDFQCAGYFPQGIHFRWILEKNFFYPFAISPYIGAGTAFFESKIDYSHSATLLTQINGIWWITGSNDVFHSVQSKRLIPMFGGGLEFFPGRFLHPRFEVRYFHSPTLRIQNLNAYHTKSLYYSLGLSTSW